MSDEKLNQLEDSFYKAKAASKTVNAATNFQDSPTLKKAAKETLANAKGAAHGLLYEKDELSQNVANHLLDDIEDVNQQFNAANDIETRD